MGKLTQHLAIYDALPSLDEDAFDDDFASPSTTGIGGGNASALTESLMNLVALPEPTSMAEVAEHTRSQLLAQRPSASASSTDLASQQRPSTPQTMESGRESSAPMKNGRPWPLATKEVV